MDTFADNKQKIFDFMNQVEQKKQAEAEDQAFKNSTNYKLKCLDKEQNVAKDKYLHGVFANVYAKSLPLSDEYKVVNSDMLNNDMETYLNAHCPNGLSCYIGESIKKGNPVAKKIMEAVDNAVNDAYNQKALHIEDYNTDDLVFRMTDDDQKKIDNITDDLNLTDLSNIINDNVKTSVQSEILRSKKEKQDVKEFETQLANDLTVTDVPAIESAMELHDINLKKDFVPSLFQGFMIGNLDKQTQIMESGDNELEYLYDAISDYGYQTESTSGEIHYATAEELAFVESVKDMTKLNMLKAMNFEKFGKSKLRDIATEAAQIK